MAALSKKALRDAAPTSQLPFELTRKYGVPVLYATFNEVRTAITNDLDKLKVTAARIGTTADRDRIGELAQKVPSLLPGDVLSGVVDEYTGVMYHASTRDRRTP
jgi:hypothetical protein